jgi:hypothetical protein
MTPVSSVSPHGARAYAVLTSPAAGQQDQGFFKFLTGLLAISGILLIKPPPYDILLFVTMSLALLCGRLSIRRTTRTPLALLAVYVCATIASSCSAVTVWEGVWYDGLTIFCGMLWWYFAELFRRYGTRGLAAVMNGYVVTSLLGVGFGLIVYSFDIPHKGELLYYDRPTGMFLDANVFGASLVPPLLYCMIKLFGSAGLTARAGWSASLLMLGVGIITCLSRGAVINAGVSLLLLMVIIAIKRPGMRTVLVGASAAMVALAAGYAIVGGVLDLNDAIVQRSRLQTYDAERWEAQAAGLEVALSHPVLGAGVGQFGAVGSPRQVLYRNEYRSLATHNTYIHVMAESGMCALVPLVLFFIVALRRGWRSLKEANTNADVLIAAWAFSCLVGVLVNACVIDAFHWRHLWLMFATPWVSPGSSGVRVLYARASWCAKRVREGRISDRVTTR